MPELCLSSSSRPPAWLSCPGSYVTFPRNSREAGTMQQMGGGVAPTRAGSRRLSEPGASERDGASASLSGPQTFLEHLLCASHRRSVGVHSQPGCGLCSPGAHRPARMPGMDANTVDRGARGLREARWLGLVASLPGVPRVARDAAGTLTPNLSEVPQVAWLPGAAAGC